MRDEVLLYGFIKKVFEKERGPARGYRIRARVPDKTMKIPRKADLVHFGMRAYTKLLPRAQEQIPEESKQKVRPNQKKM